MKHKKSHNSNNYNVISITGITAGIILILFLSQKFSITQKKNVDIGNSQNQTSEPNTNFTYITPKLLPGKDEQYKLFNHPQSDFQFEYPSNWKIIVQKHNRISNWYDVQLTDQNNTFRIYFQVNGRDYPNYEESNEYKIIGGKNITWTTLYRNGQAVESFTDFTDNDFGDKLIGLYIYLPKENQDEFNKQIEEIIASLK